MRQRTSERDWDLRNSMYKSHLWRLPNLDEPTPDYLGTSKEALMIFPIMEGGDNRLIEESYRAVSVLGASVVATVFRCDGLGYSHQILRRRQPYNQGHGVTCTGREPRKHRC